MSQATTVKDVLIATEWILNHLDWTQDAFFRDGEGRVSIVSYKDMTMRVKSVCLSGAMRLVDTPEHIRYDAILYLRSTLPEHMSSIVYFNDAEGRTKEEVLAAVRKAIEALP